MIMVCLLRALLDKVKASASFLKKRSKKLLSIGFPIAFGVRHADGGTLTATPNQVLKVFCFFFSKKKRLLV
jgi:hypothetical protein